MRALGGRAVHHTQKVLSVLPVLLPRHRVIAVGRLREHTIMIVFLLPLASIVS